MVRRWLLQQRLLLSVGIGLTLIAAALHLAGVTQRIEWQLYDAMVRGFSRVPASPQILHVDIDDDAIERFASWPWPRDVQGDLLRILHELGADRTLVDFLWTEPKPAEVRAPALDAYADLEGQIAQVGDLSLENMAYPDDELADAVRESGAVYLALYCQVGAAPAEAAGSADLADRAARCLREDFSLAAADLAVRLNASPEQVAQVLPATKRAVAQELVAARMQSTPLPGFREVHEAVLRSPFERLTADRADLMAAYVRQLGLGNLVRRSVPVPDGLKGRLPLAQDINPPVYKLTAGVARTGFVNFEADADGVLRRLPLLFEWRGRLVEQLAFAAVREVMDIRTEDLSIQDHHLCIAAGQGRPAMRIQLDDTGRMMIDWHVAKGGWESCFGHLPVGRLLQIHDARERLRQNRTLREVRLGEIIRAVRDDAGYATYRSLVEQMLQQRRSARRARLQRLGDNAEIKRLEADAAQSAQAVEQEHAMTLALVRETWAELSREPNPADPAIADEYQRFGRANRILVQDMAELEATNAAIAAQESRMVEQLRPLVAGKICLLGYTATAVADMVNTPAYERMPGVLIHSQVLNSFLQNRFRSWTRSFTDILVILFAGTTVTVVTSLRGPRGSLLFVVGVIVLGVALNAVGPFARWDLWVQIFTAVLLILAGWALMVVIRYLVTDRERRRFSRAVAQYVSPAMARQIGESAESLSFGPVDAVVSCLFSDLAGFTSLSEKLGPQGTRAVLNPYLQSMSDVLHTHQALINKFMGDGIFAFFNPPILPCAAHEAAACEAALDSQSALRGLIARHVDTPWAAEFARLSMRIGIASGAVFVGDYGSEAKLDYTCMGDVVNLAARLESANKQFGTRIMVAGGTRDAAGDRYVYRNLGLLQVKGQTRGVPVYELLGRCDEVEEVCRLQAEAFESAMRAFSARAWPEVRAILTEFLKHSPQDLAARRYLEASASFEVRPPPEDWNGTLELTEK